MIDYCKDKETCAIIVGETIGTEGWNVIKAFIEKETQDNIRRLQNVDPSDSLLIMKYQTVIKQYKKLFDYINDCVSKK